MFHDVLNIVGELLMFGDRQFYKDWWNCRNLGEYWRTWNMPVHNFFVRHVMQPMVLKVISKGLQQTHDQHCDFFHFGPRS